LSLDLVGRVDWQGQSIEISILKLTGASFENFEMSLGDAEHV
jgi:hypothetical protein